MKSPPTSDFLVYSEESAFVPNVGSTGRPTCPAVRSSSLKGVSEQTADKVTRCSRASKAIEELYEQSAQMYLPPPMTTAKIDNKVVTPRPKETYP